MLITLDDADEVDILNKFNDILERNIKCKLCGFVNIGFDTPYVFKRMIINGIEPHDKVDSSGLKPWEVDEIDLSKEWQGTSFSRASLINIAVAFGLPSPKDDISGADVGKVYWSEGEEGLKRISRYCREDVKTTINIFKKMRLEEPLEVGNTPVEDKKESLLEHLFAGGKFGVNEKKALKGLFESLNTEEALKASTIIDALVSSAKGKKTKITKAYVKELKKEISE